MAPDRVRIKAARVTLLAMLVLTSGCFTVSLGNSGGIDPAARQQLSDEVPLYDAVSLPPGAFIKVGMIMASGCDNELLGPGQGEVIAELREKAQAMGANGLTDLSCGHVDAGAMRGCFSASSCSATALKVFAPGTSPGPARSE